MRQDIRTVQQPSKRKLRRCAMRLAVELFEPKEDASILFEVRRLKARHAPPQVPIDKARWIAHRASKEAAPERREAHERGTELLTRLQYGGGGARPQ